MKVQAHGLGQLNVEVLYTLATVPCPEPSTTDWSVKRSGLARFRPEALAAELDNAIRQAVDRENVEQRSDALSGELSALISAVRNALPEEVPHT